MMNCNAPEKQTTRRIPPIACAAALAAAFTASLPQPAHAYYVTPPPVPSNIQVPAGNKAFLKGHAVGTQNYICLPCPNVITPAPMCPASGFAWAFVAPQATLFDDKGRQIITHFLSPNPDENSTARATWLHSEYSSAVWAKAIASSLDPNYVESGAIPWLLLQVVGAQDGPTGGDELTDTTFIQRLGTSGGVAPLPTTCDEATEVGSTVLVPYEADYFFYKAYKATESK